eukprot:TRINITY_DN10972_c0_g1_i1.p1 TRINITY_DN10972_c0_g1~~TRINITY_DN10972_c0_g1_i1.p1  ORF type:complete len:221 (+),score=33.59 TRINITY_DN10972_c0_g1_i1:57-665(+)
MAGGENRCSETVNAVKQDQELAAASENLNDVMVFDMGPSKPGPGRTGPPKRSLGRGDPVPEGLRRFTVPQKLTFPRALSEIKDGAKRSCWMWYMLPTAPYMVGGVEMGSSRNKTYALRSDREVLDYLEFEADNVSLRRNYLQMMLAVRDQLAAGTSAVTLMGPLDEPKLRSSVKLFARVTREAGKDAELHGVLAEVLELLGE